MANITKRGNSYRIMVSNGYDINGKQIRQSTTWTPDPSLTQRQLEKELQRQAILFEERVKHGTRQDGRIRLADFIDIYMNTHARPNLKTKTVAGYESRIPKIKKALGHIKLEDLKPGHISAFYANLQEENVRAHCVAAPKFDFNKMFGNTPISSLSNESSLSPWTFKQLKKGAAIDCNNAHAVADYLNTQYEDLFETKKDSTPLSPGTVYTYHRVLSAILSRAVAWEYIQTNPATKASLPSRRYPEATYLDEADALKLLNSLNDLPIYKKTIITFDLLSGLRRGELLGLQWQDIDFNTNTVKIQRTWNYATGKGHYYDTPKTVTGERRVKVSPAVCDLLQTYKSWQESQAALLKKDWQNKDNRVFTKEDGSPINPDSLTQWFSHFVKSIGMEKITIKSLRHTYASMMIAGNVPILAVSRQLGHAQTSTTTNIYGHVISSMEAEATKAFTAFDDTISKSKKAAGI